MTENFSEVDPFIAERIAAIRDRFGTGGLRGRTIGRGGGRWCARIASPAARAGGRTNIRPGRIRCRSTL